MNWGKVIYIFFALMSLTTIAGFLYQQHEIALFVAASVNLVSTLLKIGVRNFLSAEIFASSLVADLHLIPAFMTFELYGYSQVIYALVLGAAVANVFSLVLVVVDAAKSRGDEL